MTDVHPNPEVWPECADCRMPFVLRRCMRFGGGALSTEWLWQRDCKHKKAETVIATLAAVETNAGKANT